LFDKRQTTLIQCPTAKAGGYTLPNSVTSIESEACEGCANLTTVTIPNGVTSIGEYAFEVCTNLAGVYFQGNAPSPGTDTSVFDGDNHATVYYLPGTTGWSATFDGRPTMLLPYHYTVNNGTILITGYIGSGGAVTIPGAIDGLPVTSIGAGAFDGCTNLTSVTIPKSVTSIGGGAFASCAGLTSVDMPNSVTNIGDWAFSRCTKLTRVTIPDSVTSLGSAAFYWCTNLTRVTIGARVASIGDSAFELCTKLTRVALPNSVTNIGGSAFWGCTNLAGVTMGARVTSIGTYAFWGCTKLTSVTIPNSVTSIGPDAFNDCYLLGLVYFQGNAPSADSTVFSGDSSATLYYLPGTTGWGASFGGLPAVLFPYTYRINNGTMLITGYSGSGGAVTIPGTIFGVSVISLGDSAFLSCTGLTSVTIPNSVTSLGNSVFASCASLASVTIGANVTSLGDSVFSGCTSLISVTIPNSVTSLGDSVFASCASLASVAIGANVTSLGDSVFSGCASLASVTIPDSVTRLGDFVFDYCAGLTNVTIGNSVTNIGYNPFYCCTNLAAITVGALNPAYSSSSGVLFDQNQTTLIAFPANFPRFAWIPDTVTSIGSYAFDHCIMTAKLQIPEGVTNIGSYAFNHCTTLVSLWLSDSGTIGDSAFASCTSLVNVWLSFGLNSLGNNMFYGCTSLTNVVIPNTVTNIGDSAFAACASLPGVAIPGSVTSVGDSAFAGCTRLASLTISNGVAGIGNNAFSSCTNLVSLTIPGSVTSIGSGAFDHCTRLASLTISNGVASIGDSAFAACASLTKVTIPNSVTSLGNAAFAACTRLNAITVGALNPAYSSVAGVLFNKSQTTLLAYPAGKAGSTYAITNSVTSIGSAAFQACAGLAKVTIPNSVTNIGDFAFAACAGLAKITIPNSVASLGGDAFAACTNLTGIYFQGDAPGVGSDVFSADNQATVYCLPGTTGWASPFAGRPTVLWDILGPSVLVLSHSDLQMVASSTVTLAGSASDASRGGNGIVSVSVNGILAANGTASGTNTASWNRVVRLLPGTNSMAVVATDGWGNATTNTLRLILDQIPPALKITSPLPGQRLSNALFTVTGTARDNLRAASVWCQFNNAVWWPPSTPNGWTNWTMDLALAPGTNTVRAYAVDGAGNRSPTNRVSFIYVVSDRLLVQATGPCTLSPNYSNAWLEIGKSYTTTVTPGKGYVFSNWVGTVLGSVVTVTNTPRLTFIMQSNLCWQANIIPNPFIPFAGNYYGLVYDLANGVQQPSAGFFSGTLGTGGLLSGMFQMGGGSGWFTGQFDVGGRLRQTVTRTWSTPLGLDLQLAGDGTLSGTVSNVAWTSTLQSYRAVFNAATNPCPYAGRYTLVIPGEAGEPGYPAGSGCGMVTVNQGGLAVLSGWLADGTVVSPSVPVSQEGDWPLYVSLYSGQGSLMAWLKFTLPAGLTNTAASWIKPANPAGKYYPGGFTNVCEMAGSSYLYVKTNRVLALTNGVMVFSGGNLAAPLTNEVLLTATNAFLNQGANPMAVTVGVTNGYLSGWFKVPGARQTNQFKGVLLPEQNRGEGYFLGTNQSGRVLLGPAP